MPAIKSYTTFPLRKQAVTPFIRKESFLTKQCHGNLKGILYDMRFPTSLVDIFQKRKGLCGTC